MGLFRMLGSVCRAIESTADTVDSTLREVNKTFPEICGNSLRESVFSSRRDLSLAYEAYKASNAETLYKEALKALEPSEASNNNQQQGNQP